MKFYFKGRTKTGEIQEGLVNALNESYALNALAKKGLVVLKLEKRETEKFSPIAFLWKIWERPSAKDFVIFSRQLAVLIDSKVSLLAALATISEQMENRFFALRVRSIMSDVDGGLSFSEALEKYPDTFSKFYVNMVKAGETSGNLNKVLNDLANNIEKNYELTSKLRGAMYYPGFIFSAMIVVGFLVMTFVMPKLLEILKESKATLPIQTRILIFVSDFLASYWWAVGLAMIGAVVGMVYYLRTEDGKNGFDHFVLKVPVIKKILNNIYVARFTENFSVLIQSGLPVTTALLITSDVIGNEVYRKILREAVEAIKKGDNIAKVFVRYEIIPPIVTQMISVGENTGRLDYMMSKITSFYSNEADRMTRNFSTLVEPVIMVILAIGVGILVSAVLLPIYQVATSIK